MSFHGWEKSRILLESGEEVDGIAPVIVSASRATDIPAFFAPWFISRLKEGYVQWTNPFNAKQVQYVSFRNTRVIVFWSKNPSPLLPFLCELDVMGIGYYFQFTLNDYEEEKLELNLPSLQARVETFRMLADSIGRKRVIWRFDPLMLSRSLSVDVLLDRIARLAEMLRGYTEKLVVSFVDIERYRMVRKRLARLGIEAREFTPAEMVEFAEKLLSLNQSWGFEIATCAEEIELDGIAHNRCIDDRLMRDLFGKDEELMDFPGFSQDLFGPSSFPSGIKDRGQRKLCGCIASKDIGRYGTCNHHCVYCYANLPGNGPHF